MLYKNNLSLCRIEYIEENVTLTFDKCTLDDEGDYTVKAVNEKGVASCSAEVLVHVEAPKVTKPLSDVTVKVKDTAHLECTITGLPKPEVIWMSDTVILKDSPKYKITSRDDDYILEVKDVTLEDTEKTYTCKASNVAGDDSTSAKIIPEGLFDVLVLTYSMLMTVLHITPTVLYTLCRVLNKSMVCSSQYHPNKSACLNPIVCPTTSQLIVV